MNSSIGIALFGCVSIAVGSLVYIYSKYNTYAVIERDIEDRLFTREELETQISDAYEDHAITLKQMMALSSKLAGV